MRVFFGVLGGMLGFVAAILLMQLGGFVNKADPIMSGLIALLVIGPIGAVAGALLGTKLAMSMRQDKDAPRGGLTKSTLKALGVFAGLVALAVTLFYLYAVSTATPWLNPNGGSPVLQFEVRLAPGAALPASPKDVRFDLQTDLNTMPGEVHPARFRRDGDRPVIAGEVELAFRTRNRELEVKIAGRPDRTYQIRLTDKAPHTSELGRWEAHPDGSEIRYRAKWPGRV